MYNNTYRKGIINNTNIDEALQNPEHYFWTTTEGPRALLSETLMHKDVDRLKQLLDFKPDIYGSMLNDALLMCSKSPRNEELIEVLLDKGASVDFEKDHPRALINALLIGDKEAIAILKKYGANMALAMYLILKDRTINVEEQFARPVLIKYLAEQDSQGRNVGFFAVNNGNQELLTTIYYKYQLDINAQDHGGNTVLHVAASQENPRIIETLAAYKPEWNRENSLRLRPLDIALSKQHFNTAKRILEHGADINLLNSEKKSSLYIAIKENNIQAIDFLLENNAYHSPLRKPEQFVILAVLANAEQSLKHLLSKGAGVNHSAPDGRSILHLAADAGADRVLALLVRNGADINAVYEGCGGTPLHFAAEAREFSCFDYQAFIAKLLEFEPDKNKLDHKGNSALHRAALANRPNICRQLLTYGLDPELKNTEGNTAVHLAAQSGSAELLKVFINSTQISRKKLSLANSVNLRGETILFLAALHIEDTGLVKTIKEWPADINASNLNGKRVLDLIPEADILKRVFLESLGAKPSPKQESAATSQTGEQKQQSTLTSFAMLSRSVGKRSNEGSSDNSNSKKPRT